MTEPKPQEMVPIWERGYVNRGDGWHLVHAVDSTEEELKALGVLPDDDDERTSA